MDGEKHFRRSTVNFQMNAMSILLDVFHIFLILYINKKLTLLHSWLPPQKKKKQKNKETKKKTIKKDRKNSKNKLQRKGTALQGCTSPMFTESLLN